MIKWGRKDMIFSRELVFLVILGKRRRRVGGGIYIVNKFLGKLSLILF